MFLEYILQYASLNIGQTVGWINVDTVLLH